MNSSVKQQCLNQLPFINAQWDNDIIPQLQQYIRIPNKSPAFDPNWEKNGYMAQAMQLIIQWCKKQPIKDLQLQLLQDPGHTPLLLIDIAGQLQNTVLLYGHMDKQPEMTGWDDDLGPWTPVLKGDKLYGRGSADDGYSVFAALTAILALQRANIPHARCVIMIEASEESGSYDLLHYLQKIQSKIGHPDLVITLDSDCGNYEQLWVTTNMRGLVGGILTINTLSEGIHSGISSGIAPSVFTILRQLLDRVENAQTSKILMDDFYVDIPADRIEQAKQASKQLGSDIIEKIPFLNPVQPIHSDSTELILNNTWRPALSITGIDDVPHIDNAGNVTLPTLAVKLSFRLPPNCNYDVALNTLKSTLEKDPPYNAIVKFEQTEGANGWQSPPIADWLKAANTAASQTFYDKPACYLGSGGSIPFMSALNDMYPNTQFLITGVLGPHSNAHGPNEFLHIPMVKKLTGCVAMILAMHYEQYEN